jgi:D-3-phosphoglycerate dehydrogenase/glyoxylate/hydroxypyruvate reductase A
MSVLIMSKPIPHDGFVTALRESGLPHPIHTSLDDVDPLSVRWLIAWRLPAGVLPKLPNLELLYCCAAGADKLLATPDLPASLPVSRVSDDAQAIELAQYVVHAAHGLQGFTHVRHRRAQRSVPSGWMVKRATVWPAGSGGSACARPFTTSVTAGALPSVTFRGATAAIERCEPARPRS